MGDAEIIPIGTRGRPGRGTGEDRPSSAARNLAAADGCARPRPPNRARSPGVALPRPPGP